MCEGVELGVGSLGGVERCGVGVSVGSQGGVERCGCRCGCEFFERYGEVWSECRCV